MGNPQGFIKYEREVAEDRPVFERIKDWDEFHLHLDDEELKTQASRCMNCGVPFCHSGLLIKGAASGCPLHNVIPEFNDLVYKGRWRDAAEMLLTTNIFPEFTGRVCPAPCEGSCVLGYNKLPVTIKQIELEIIERAFREGWIKPNPPKHRSGKRVAVIGSGPAGLAAAHELNRMGHDVTVFERADRPGGLLMYGIPSMKLDKKIIDRRINLMREEGVKFITGTEVGKNIPAKKLVNQYDASILCCGATKPRDLIIEGRELDGVHFAMDFLHLNTKSFLDSRHRDNKYISAKDKNVVIIGGGDTGTDCVATSIRHGAKSVKQFEIMQVKPEKRDPGNPWPEWPNVLLVDYGQKEAMEIFGSDPRQYLLTAKKFSGSSGKVTEVITTKVEWKKDPEGRFNPVEVKNSEQSWEAELVLLAMGFVSPEETIIGELEIETTERLCVKAEFGSFKTNIDKIYSAGDMRRGQSLVVWAVAEGRCAAKSCNEYLSA